MKNKEEIVEVIKEYFSVHKGIIAVYLFGSVARGTFNKKSDVDIALMLDKGLDKIDIFDLKLKIAVDLEQLLGVEVDIVIFNDANLRLKHQILKGELVIGENNPLRVKKESRAVSEYLDMRYFYDVYEEGMLRVRN